MPQDAQIAQLMERINHIAKGIDELKPLAALAVRLEADQKYTSDHVRQLQTTADLRASAMHVLDKRLVVLERWHKFMVALPTFMLAITLTAAGYISSYIKSLDEFNQRTDARLTVVEFVIRSPAFEQVMEQNNVTQPEKTH